jgi:hypothetical protein
MSINADPNWSLLLDCIANLRRRPKVGCHPLGFTGDTSGMSKPLTDFYMSSDLRRWWTSTYDSEDLADTGCLASTDRP